MVSIVIPIYLKEPLPGEKISLGQCCEVLKDYELIFVAPYGLDVEWYKKFCDKKIRFSFKEFEPDYFTGIAGYNRLMLSSEFYKCFIEFEYILIYQLDVFVFENLLSKWVLAKFDYIGAPWINTDWQPVVFGRVRNSILTSQSFFYRQFTRIKWMLSGLSKSSSVTVGNGGCSLRKVATFYDLTNKLRAVIANWKFSEDLFWSIYVPLSGFQFKIAKEQNALQFSFDYDPALCLKVNNGNLPFVGHAWCRNDPPYTGNLDFWKPIVAKTLVVNSYDEHEVKSSLQLL